MDQLTDEQIVDAILNGDKDLYREIIRRYEKKLSHYLLKFLSDRGYPSGCFYKSV
jgi:DNA-binding FadR family transcriptional regulator